MIKTKYKKGEWVYFIGIIVCIIGIFYTIKTIIEFNPGEFGKAVIAIYIFIAGLSIIFSERKKR